MYSDLVNVPIIHSNLCGAQDNMQRKAIKFMLQNWDREHPGRVESIFRSIANVSLSQLADTSRFSFSDLRISSHAVKNERVEQNAENDAGLNVLELA